MRMLCTHNPGKVNQECPHPRLARASAGKGNRVSGYPLEARTIESISRQFERADSESPGLLLLDALLRPLYANEEAVCILCYPESPNSNKRLGCSLARKVDSLHPKRARSSPPKFFNEFASGRRHYQIQVFTLKSRLGKGPGPTVAVLLKRNHGASLALSRIRQKFRLTQRETEALELLMQGYTTKDIASRMDISPNTAKAFLRSVMFKTEACDRSGILARILQLSKGVTA